MNARLVKFSFLAVSCGKEECIGELIRESENDLGLSWFGIQVINKMTNGIFLELWGGIHNRRCVLLESRRQHIDDIKKILPHIPENCSRQQWLKRRLEFLINNAEACLEQHGANAAMVVH